jgi:citrate lyase subunit beta/citryl-CoA lyase
VAPDRKDAARDLVLRLRPPIVRLNGVGTRWFDDDLAAAAELELEAIMLPKATPEAAAALGAEGPPVIAIV